MQNHPLVIAHRGARDQAPENTLSAFRLALDHGADGIELDVQLSADGIPILFHDRTLGKLGRRRRVCNLNSSQLAGLDWGAWYHPKFKAEPMPTLEGALNLLQDCPHMLIEIKTQPGDHHSGHARRLTETVIQMIGQSAKKQYHHRIWVLCFDTRVLTMAHQMAPHLRYVLNTAEKNPFDALEHTPYLQAVDANISKLDKSMAQGIRARGLNLFTYTCNGPRQVAKALKHGADAIITDRPQWLRQFLS